MTLRGCPFCGSTDVHVTLYNHPSVVGHTCWAIGPKGTHLAGGKIQEAIRTARELWNKRAEPDCRTGAVSVLLEGIVNPLSKGRSKVERGFNSERFRALTEGNESVNKKLEEAICQ